MLNKLLFLIIATSPFLSIKPINNKVEDSLNETSKLIYVDVSLSDNFKQEDHNDLYIKYAETSIPLTYVDNDIYVTSDNVPLEDLSNNIEIYSSNYSSVLSGDDSLIKDNYNYVALSNDNDVEGYGYYSNRSSNPGATYETQRVWLHKDKDHDFYSNDSWGTPKISAISYIKNNKYEVMAMEEMLNSNGDTYCFVDIPVNVSSIHFYQIANTNSHNYLIYDDVNIKSLTYGVCYEYVNENNTLAAEPMIVYDASAYLLGEVVTAYLTYGQYDSNGASKTTISNVFATWFKNKSASSQELKDVKILDYTGYSANGNSYEGLTKNASFSINEKWNTLCSQAGIDPNTGNARSVFPSFANIDVKFVIFVIFSTLLLSGAVVVFFLYKKRRKTH